MANPSGGPAASSPYQAEGEECDAAWPLGKNHLPSEFVGRLRATGPIYGLNHARFVWSAFEISVHSEWRMNPHSNIEIKSNFRDGKSCRVR